MEYTYLKHVSACFLAMMLVGPTHAQTGGAGNAPQVTNAAGSQDMKLVRHGTQASTRGPAQNFTGSVRVDPLFGANSPSRTTGAYVTFEPGARSGRVQSWGGAVQELRPGDVVWTPPNVKHWHGASPTNAMTHMAISEQQEGKAVTWMEKVTDVQYGAKP